MKTRPVTLQLPLTEEELAANEALLDRTYAQLGHARHNMQERRKELTAKHRAESKRELGELREELREAKRKVEECLDARIRGTHEADVPCEERLDYDTNMVTVVRLDIKSVVSQRPMTPEELKMRHLVE